MRKLKSNSHHRSSRISHLTNQWRIPVINPGEIFRNKGNLITMIRFYAGHECLWNCQHGDYFNENKRRELWSWITRQFGGNVSRSQVEYVMKILHAKALQEFKRMDRCRQKGVRFSRPTFDLLEEFYFLLQDVEEPEPISEESAPKETSNEVLQSPDNFFGTAEDSNLSENYDLNEFCSELKEELTHLPRHTCIEIQRKISLILTSSKV